MATVMLELTAAELSAIQAALAYRSAPDDPLLRKIERAMERARTER